jgi:hypothetical protein
VTPPVNITERIYQMDTKANWPSYQHAGHRDQSILSAQKFYQTIILGAEIFRRGNQKGE